MFEIIVVDEKHGARKDNGPTQMMMTTLNDRGGKMAMMVVEIESDGRGRSQQ